MGIAIPQVVTEDRASGALVIDGSLRFDKDKLTHLTRTPSSSGNRNNWTISCWIKRGKIGVANQRIFESGTTAIRFGGDIFQWIDGSGGNNGENTPAAKLRDTGWYHLVFAWDNSQGAFGNRIYVNGVELVYNQTGSGNPLSASAWNAGSQVHTIGANQGNTSRYYDGMMSQCYFIDGLTLGPEYFGYTDPLTNVWRPKKFKAEGTTANDGRTWSSGISNANPSHPGTNLFNNNVSNYVEGTNGGGDVTFSGLIEGSKIEFYGNRQGNSTLSINGVDKTSLVPTSVGWFTIPDTTSITSLAFNRGASGNYVDLYAIRVDGVMLRDNITQNLDFGTNGFYLPMDGNLPIGKDQSGKGNDWKPVNFSGSADITKATGAKPILNTSNGGNLAAIGVFGSKENRFYETTSASNSGGKYVFEGLGTQPTFSFIRGATYTFDWSASSGHPLRFATAADAAGSTEYTDGTNVSGNVTKITVPHNAPDTLYYYCNVHNGMGNSISVTTDESKADPYAWKCVFAAPLVGAMDKSDKINATSTAKTTVVGNDAVASNASSNFYGGSYYFDGTGDDIDATITALGTRDFTLECWNETTATSALHTLFEYGDHTSNGFIIETTGTSSPNPITLFARDSTSGSAIDIANATYNSRYGFGRGWHHIALQRASNVATLFVDGIRVGTATWNSNYSSTNLRIGNATYSAGSAEGMLGYIQDVRLYDGVAKYSASADGEQAFIVPSTDPDIVPDAPSGVGVKTKLDKVTDGAVDFTGSNQYLKTNASSADFVFGTGDFTVEMMLYNRETAGKGFIHLSDTAGGLKPTSSGVITIHKGSDNNGQNGIFRAYIKNGSTGFSQTVPYKKWCHVALVRESGTIKLFVDGKQDATTVTGDTTSYNTPYVAIGGYYDTNYLSNCTISNVRINKGTAVYTKDFTPPTAPLTNITNTKLLCCQSNTSTLDAAVTPSGVSIAANWMPAGYTYWNAGYRAGWFKNAPQKITAQTLSDYIPSAMPTSGKHYWEIKVTNVGTYHVFGVTDDGGNAPGNDGYQDHMSGIYYNGSTPVFLAKKNNGTSTADRITHGESTGTTFSNNDVLMFALDADSNKMWIGKNGVWYDSGDPSAGTNASFQNMPTSGAYFKTAYSTTGSGTMKFQIMSASVGPKVSASNPFTDDINAVRGQEGTYATLDPIHKGAQVTLSEGNLKVSVAGGSGRIFYSTLGATSGKWYAEYTAISATSTNMIGISRGKNPTASYLGADGNHGYGYYGNGQRYVGGTGTPWNDGFTTGDTIGIALDLDNREVSMYKNGNYLGVLADSLPRKTTQYEDTYFFAGGEGSQVGTMNFGQKPFKFPPPDGFQPLTITALRQITPIPRPDKFVGATLYTGSGDTVSPRAIELPHSADLVWVKSRDRASNHQLADTVRGNGSVLATNNTQTARNPTTQYTGGGVSSINGKTVTLASGTTNNQNLNTLNEKGVVWSWKAGGSSNTFNVDDVGYASASDVNMSVGALDAVAYNKDQTWSNGLTASSGLADAAYAFNGNLSNRAQSALGTNAKLFFAPPSPLSFTERVEIYCDQGDNTPKAYWNGNIISPGGSKWITIAVGSGTIDATNPIIIDTRGASQYATLKAVRVDGRLLINNGASTSSVPSIANTGSSVGTKQGFSIVKYQGNGNAATIAHGLTQRPDLIIHKFINGSSNWSIWHPDLSASERFIFTSDGPQSSSSFQNVNKYTFDVASGHNDNGVDMITYCWHDVPGLQKFGTYLGNNSTDGPFIELGFKPAIIMFKNLDTSANWMIYDSKRDARNQGYRDLFPNLNNVENSTATDNEIDFLSNGFKLRNDDGQSNDANQYVYMAWAESPVANMFGATSNAV